MGWDNHPLVFKAIQKVVHDMDEAFIDVTGVCLQFQTLKDVIEEL